jgi:hypothetical protein
MEWDIAAAHAICLKANCNVYAYLENLKPPNEITPTTIIQYNKKKFIKS